MRVEAKTQRISPRENTHSRVKLKSGSLGPKDEGPDGLGGAKEAGREPGRKKEEQGRVPSRETRD